ncbi:SDR family oxidoreductase [Litorivicinus lipolyticus]|uniref:SDR family oxidoreductase n=1 Tax=Litorivicinus lipolyticus TaxID=418701 RepID=A0A5Q2QDB2_9GAMM|nr:SDR family oxidoreductase [Litorivicinus lipolyticus]QGG79987.1 SDR family oxidoreductase [Litorivicinus lipolyticus]
MSGLFDLTGKTALVTGVKRGIGRGIAEGLAGAGADIIGVSATLDPHDSDVGRSVTSMGRRFDGYAADFSDRASVDELIQQLNASARRIDILVNNAGTIMRAPAIEHPDDWFDQVIEVNLRAQFVLTKAVAKGMLERGTGKIIFTASLLTFQGGITVPGYAASKGAIGQLTKALANEWAGKGVCVNAIAPGYVATDNTQALQDDAGRYQSIVDRIPVGRWGVPDDFAGPAVFLASSASDYVQGTVLTVDGGWMGR